MVHTIRNQDELASDYNCVYHDNLYFTMYGSIPFKDCVIVTPPWRGAKYCDE